MGLKHKVFKYCFPEFLSAATIRNRPCDSGIVLMYHEVLPDEINLPAWTVVKFSDFCWQIKYIQKHFDIVNIDEGIDRVQGRSKGKKPFAIVTFDDGYKGNFVHVFPLMKSMCLPFTVYISTKAIIENNLFWFDHVISLLEHSEDVHVKLEHKQNVEIFMIPANASETIRWQATEKLLEKLKRMSPNERSYWVKHITEKYKKNNSKLKMLHTDDLKKLASSDLVTIGSHTHGHEMLDQLDVLSIYETLHKSNHVLIDIINSKPKHFSYPNGNYNQKVINKVQKMGYKTAVTANSGIWNESISLMEIPRMGIGRFCTEEHFKAKISGYL